MMAGRAQFTFSHVPSADIQRSSFDRSFQHKTTFDSGLLIPVFIDEALPGDTFNVRMTAFARLATPLHPFMDNLHLDSFFFAVPIRLLWENWERFNGAQDDPDDTTDYLMPEIVSPAGGYLPNTIFDYMGLPVGVANVKHRADFLRAYNLIWNEWFRDENLQNSVTVLKTDGPDPSTNYGLLKRGKRHDYFTSALPWPQKGPSVPLPLTGDAPIKGLGINSTASTFPFTTLIANESNGATRTYPHGRIIDDGTVAGQLYVEGQAASGFPSIFADLGEVTAATINELRQAFQIQKLYERDARGGTRYTEIVRSHFGVVSPDARLQRPEYLGGGSSPVNVSPIAQNSGSGAYTPTPQGNLAAMGTSTMKGHGFSKSFTEHCVIIGMVCARADLTYQQGMERMWSRRTRWDFYWPALAHIGEQAVLQKEIFADGTVADDVVFGYQERWAEYRYKPSKITGEFRSSFAQSLDTWHLSQDFAAAPTLNAAFIEENPPVDRVIAVVDEPHFLFDSIFMMKCARPMPVYSVPGLIDHF
ncbi:MAG: major capsid protein [Microvirus sp.]|nr:MAG: major capsid protein [Microvirus sp.]